MLHAQIINDPYSRGRRDYEYGRKVNQNPFPTGKARRAWTSGWTDAHRPAARWLQPMTDQLQRGDSND